MPLYKCAKCLYTTDKKDHYNNHLNSFLLTYHYIKLNIEKFTTVNFILYHEK